MPREQKKRGRREDAKNNKRKRDETQHGPSKRYKAVDEHDQEPKDEIHIDGDAGDDFIGIGVEPSSGVQAPEDEDQFHGLLDPQEQEYYANINSKIVANDFESDEDRDFFIQAVYRETEGKELKVASSQSCSRYLEKIIMLSTADQLRLLFTKFLGNLTYLVRHRFGSHCCETLFLNAAKRVGEEPDQSHEDGEGQLSMEQLFLRAAEELQPSIGFLLTDRFASHTVRVLFLILSGESLDDESTKTILASKKKEKLEAPITTGKDSSQSKRRVPKSFRQALTNLIQSTVSSVDATYLRALATHPTGNPVLQLLLRLELTLNGKNQQAGDMSLFKKLLPDEDLEDDSESSKFIVGLLYDPVGSHLVEILVLSLSGKIFKKLYKNVLKPRLTNMVKNEIASYVAIKVLERLGKDDLSEAKDEISPELPLLVSRRRLGLIKVLVERFTIRGVEVADVTDALSIGFGPYKATWLSKLLSFEPSKQPASSEDDSSAKRASPPQKTDVHGSLLAQAMLQNPKMCQVVQDSLLEVEIDTLVQMCQNAIASRVIQAALVPSQSNVQFRRPFVPRFYGHIATLAQNASGSYVVDALWAATDGLHFMKESVANELAHNASHIRESQSGRTVLHNWELDMYQRRPAEWRALAKGQDKADDEVPQDDVRPERKKTGIELARERHVQKKTQGPRGKTPGKTPATSSNAIVAVGPVRR
ncbi:armadillo-type protein [Exophiala viscosa]|uniref:Nucleolar protein 9 n=1 Tax=Exophiala viscosa TaxID=2486360 RepID=A0AAN6DMI0_9EURO|nr:armadillo-type protein [Exophiala viscosa]KAI1621021.1 armadillo-type protein [Exophiala viscosa]